MNNGPDRVDWYAIAVIMIVAVLVAVGLIYVVLAEAGQ